MSRHRKTRLTGRGRVVLVFVLTFAVALFVMRAWVTLDRVEQLALGLFALAVGIFVWGTAAVMAEHRIAAAQEDR